jgi:hypothetical protein
MPWRPDFLKGFWLDPDWVGLSGYSDQKDPSDAPPVRPARTMATRVKREYPTYTGPAGTREPLGAAVFLLRDRIGMEYEREVGLDDFVSIREAAELLQVPVMTLSRWVKSKKIRSSRKNKFVVIRLREVLRILQERGTPPKLGIRHVILGDEDSFPDDP